MAKHPKPETTVVVDVPSNVAPTAAPPPPWRTVAFARRAVTLPLGGGTMRVLGGEWITEPADVATLRGMDDAFDFVAVDGPAHLAEVQARVEADVAHATSVLRDLGRVVLRDGAPLPKRPR